MDDRVRAAQSKIFDEIHAYARSKQAEGVRSKYAPKPPEQPEAEGASEQSDELDAESLSRLAAMAGE